MNILERIIESWNNLSNFIDNIIQSYPITILRIISGIISLILFVFILYLKKDAVKMKISRLKTFIFQAGIEDRNFINQWKEAIKLAKIGDNLSYKKSILLADKLVINVLIDIGIYGKSFEEKIENVKKKYSIENDADLIRVHNEVIKYIENDYLEITKEEVINILSVYEKLLRKIGLF